VTSFAEKHVAGSVVDLIGHTPVVRFRRLVGPTDAAVWAKVEKHNPGGSIKDRIARSMIARAEQDGVLHPGDRIVEPTSGNTGLGLAMVGAAKGYPVVLVMPETASLERPHSLRYRSRKSWARVTPSLSSCPIQQNDT